MHATGQAEAAERALSTYRLPRRSFNTPAAIGSYPAPPFQTERERMPDDDVDLVLRGRALVISMSCGDCHGEAITPEQQGWLAGMRLPDMDFFIGSCSRQQPDTQPCFRTRPRNLTPANATGLGRFSERQIFNALRYGQRPGETPDVEITSTTPGVGSHPSNPKYLAPPMPWPAWRHLSDVEIRAIAVYLKRAVRPVRNRVEDSEGPPDFWLEAGLADSYELARDFGSATIPLSGAHYAVYAGDRWRRGQRVTITMGVRAEALALYAETPYVAEVDSVFGRRTDDTEGPHPPEASPPGRPAPTSAQLRGFFVVRAGSASPARGRCVTQLATGG